MTPTNIEWSDWVWNTIRGCSRVSAGCINCYAESVALRFSGTGLAYEGLARRGPDGSARWTGEVRFLPQHLDAPLRRGRRHRLHRQERVFVNSMSDLFHEKLDFEVLAAVFGVMHFADWHRYQILTKRPKVMLEFFDWLGDRPLETIEACVRSNVDPKLLRGLDPVPLWPLWNVDLGVSAENQETFDERWPQLQRAPAWTRWVSYEPAIGPLDTQGAQPLRVFRKPLPSSEAAIDAIGRVRRHRRLRGAMAPALDWIVVGGETGHRARAVDIGWFDAVARASALSGVPVFVKQLGVLPQEIRGGELVPLRLGRRSKEVERWPERLQLRQRAPAFRRSDAEELLAAQARAA